MAYDDVDDAATNKNSKGTLYSLNDSSKVFQGHNSPYNVAYRNCFDKTYTSLSKGILANGMNAGKYMKGLGFKGGIIPNNAISKFGGHTDYFKPYNLPKVMNIIYPWMRGR